MKAQIEELIRCGDILSNLAFNAAQVKDIAKRWPQFGEWRVEWDAALRNYRAAEAERKQKRRKAA